MVRRSVNLATERRRSRPCAARSTAADAAGRASQRAGYEARALADGAAAARRRRRSGAGCARSRRGRCCRRRWSLPMLRRARSAVALDAAGVAAVRCSPRRCSSGSARASTAPAGKALRAGTGNMDLLVALGTSAAYGLSLYCCWRGAGHGDAAPVLRGGGGGDHAGAARQVARGARQAPDHRRDPRAAGAAPGHRARAARRRRASTCRSRDVRVGDQRGRAPGRARAGRRRGARRAAATSTNRCSPARACRWPSEPATRVDRRRDQRRGPLLVLRRERGRRRDRRWRASSGWSSRRRRARRRSSAWSTASSAVFVPVVLAIAALTLARLAAGRRRLGSRR